MKIRNLKRIKLNLRVRSQASDIIGTIIKTEKIRGLNYYWVQWDGESKIYSGFFENDCDCEVLDEHDQSIP